MPSPLVMRFFRPPGRGVVQIQLAPVLFLGKPDDLVAGGQIAPVHGTVARLVERVNGLGQDLANGAGRGIRDAQDFLLVIARGRHERDRLAIVRPLHVGPFVAAAGDVVAERRAMLIRRHLEADDLLRHRVDDDAVEHGDRRVTRQRIFPGLQSSDGRRRCPRGTSRRRCADPAERWRSFSSRATTRRIGRVAPGPAGVVRGVAEVLDPVGRQRGFVVGALLADPQVPVADEGGLRAVG